ncbi:MAG: hypothetical protein N2235_23085, partial [Fischerella sp.]|nr:hypothetical protein [Fischerella sp.]
DEQRYATPAERRELYNRMIDLGVDQELADHVPVIAHNANLFDTLGIQNVEQLLKFAEGKSINHPVREGLVFKRADGKFSFKAISNLYLLGEKG